MTNKITIRKGQLGLLAREGDYYQVLEAGEHRQPWFNKPELLVVNIDGSDVAEGLAEYLRRFQPQWVERYCHRWPIWIRMKRVRCTGMAYCRRSCRPLRAACTGKRMKR